MGKGQIAILVHFSITFPFLELTGILYTMKNSLQNPMYSKIDGCSKWNMHKMLVSSMNDAENMHIE